MQSRDIDRTKKDQVQEANKYFFVEAAIALFVSFLVNVFVTAVFAEGFYGRNVTQVVILLFVIYMYSTVFRVIFPPCFFSTVYARKWIYLVKISFTHSCVKIKER